MATVNESQIKMSDSIVNIKEINKADVVLLGVAYEKTASSHKGTIHGPKAVIGCLNEQVEFFDRKFKTEVKDVVKIAYEDLGNLEKLLPEQMVKMVERSCYEIVKNNKIIFLVGGEHSVSIGHLQALANKYKSDEVTILQIDAHCDLRQDDSDYNDKNSSTFAHSTVMRHASELGYNTVQVGIRTYSKEEYEYWSNHENKITVFEWGKKEVSIEEILKAITTKYLYITIDVDGFDPSVMPGTGTPASGGLSWYYGNELIMRAIDEHELVGADIVEVSPVKDSVLTEYNAAQLLYSMIGEKFQNRLK